MKYGTLPNTGMWTTNILGITMTANNMIAAGICIMVFGLIVFKLWNFKIKDSKR